MSKNTPDIKVCENCMGPFDGSKGACPYCGAVVLPDVKEFGIYLTTCGLDGLAEIYGIARSPDETEDELKIRVINKIKGMGGTTR